MRVGSLLRKALNGSYTCGESSLLRDLDSDGVFHSANELHVGAIELPCALPDPQHVSGAVVVLACDTTHRYRWNDKNRKQAQETQVSMRKPQQHVSL